MPSPAREGELLERTVFEVKRVIVGQDRLVERVGRHARIALPGATAALARPQGAHGDHSRDRVGDGFVKDEFLGHCAHSMVGLRGRTGTAAATFDHNSFRFGKL